jgi:hypothetical protein
VSDVSYTPSHVDDHDRALMTSAEPIELAQLTPQRVRELSAQHGIERATAILYRSVLHAFPESVEILTAAESTHAAACSDDNTLFAIMPGAFHQDYPETGGDGRQLLALGERLGCRVERVPIGSFDLFQKNAATLQAWLHERRQTPRIVLASLSKGGADVKIALRDPKAAETFRNVVAWVNFSGMVNGTPLIEWLRTRRLRYAGVRLTLWWLGHAVEPFHELRHGTGAPLDGWPPIPEHLRVFHVLGFPTRRHLTTAWARRGYERLATLGPNDGGGLVLADAVHSPGVIVPIWGADHYLQPTWDVLPLLTGILRRAARAPRQATAPPADVQNILAV